MTDILQPFMAEYNALRREIELLIEHQKDIMNFSILTIVAMATLFGAIEAKKELQPVSYVYLVFPWIFLLLALLYADKTARILRVADYIHNYLRREIIEMCGDENVLQWELYKSNRYSFRRKLALVLDRIRWFIFFIPAFFSFWLFFLLSDDIERPLIDFVILMDFIIFAIFVVIVMIWAILPLEETSPIEDRPVVDLKKRKKRRKRKK